MARLTDEHIEFRIEKARQLTFSIRLLQAIIRGLEVEIEAIADELEMTPEQFEAEMVDPPTLRLVREEEDHE